MARLGSENKLKIFIVEDEDLYRDLLKVALSQGDRYEVIGAFATGQAAIDAAPRLKPQVAILDIELGSELNGIQVGLLLREELPELGIILLSNHGDPHFVSSLPQETIAGWSYLLKKSVADLEALTRAVEGAASGFVVLDPALVSSLRPRPKTRLEALTARQQQVLELMAQGYSNPAIAENLHLGVKAVENYINAIYQQLAITQKEPIHPRVKAVLTYLQDSRTS